METIVLQRSVAHKGYWCDVYQQGWMYRQFDCPDTGQRETLMYPRKVYVPVDDVQMEPAEVEDQAGTVIEAEQLAERRKRDLLRKKRLAKTKCRHAIKSHSLGQLLTGTYRENMVDFDRAHSDFAKFQRLMRKYIPGWRAVHGFEEQGRGAWHWHAAVDKMPQAFMVDGQLVRSFDFPRRMWERVVGSKQGTVNVDGHVRGRKRHRDQRKASLARIAGYLSKYLHKATAADVEGRRMWGRTQGLQSAKPVTFEVVDNLSFADAARLAFQVPDGHRVVRHWCNPIGNTWLLYTEPEG